MKEFILNTETKEVTFRFPTTVDEISAEYLLEVTKNIHVADHYTLVGMLYHETLGSVILARKQAKKTITGGVIPIFIKAGNTDSEFIKSAKCKEAIIISPTQLNLGHHAVASANVLSLDYFVKVLDQDTTVAKRYANNYGQEECYFVEFKIVPNCDVIGFYETADSTPNVGDYISIENLDTQAGA